MKRASKFQTVVILLLVARVAFPSPILDALGHATRISALADVLAATAEATHWNPSLRYSAEKRAAGNESAKRIDFFFRHPAPFCASLFPGKTAYVFYRAPLSGLVSPSTNDARAPPENRC